MKITIIGTGYVGLVSGVCLAKIGHEVICVDNNLEKISKLQNAIIPIFEPGLKELLLENHQRISFTNNLKEALDQTETVFIAVGTPQDEDGSADLSFVMEVVKEIALKSSAYKLIITKSTVPVGTGDKIKKIVKETNPNLNFSVASNPEFLREGNAIIDFLKPDRIVIGVEDDKSKQILSEIYRYFPVKKIIITDITTAELIKYASNAFLATKISFINEMANLCEKTGSDIKNLALAIGLDSRIGEKFLNVGPGFGGSCFPKDISAILNIAKKNAVELSLIKSVNDSNVKRFLDMAKKVSQSLNGEVRNKKIAFLGLAFKANTDDIRYSPAIEVAKILHQAGAILNLTDIAAINNAKKELENFNNINFFENYYDSIKDADAIVIATEWNEYKNLDLEKVKSLTHSRNIIDLRNIFDAKIIEKAGFKYNYIGKKND